MPDSFDETDPFAADDSLSDKEAREIERRMNIHRLKNEANEIAGGEMTGFESPDLPSEISEQFWQNVVAFEKAPRRSGLSQLEEAGISMPPADTLSDDLLYARLWKIIDFLATKRFFIYWTNHLSDRELYSWLREEGLTESIPSVPGMNFNTSPIGSGNEEDTLLHFRFYANDEDRQSWMKQFPDYEMPAKESAPFERDYLLPQADYSLPDDGAWDDDDDDLEDDPELDEDTAPR